MIMDLVSRLLTALFASSSAIAGWALWQNEAGKHVWIVLSGVTALVAILDGVLGSRDKLKRYAELSGSFVRLSQSLQGLLSDMRIEPNFDTAKIRPKRDEVRTRYSELLEQYPVDLFFTRKSENRVQEALNQKLEYATNQDSRSTAEAATATAT